MNKLKFLESLKIQEMSPEPSSDHDSVPPNLQISLLTPPGASRDIPNMTRRGLPRGVIFQASARCILNGAQLDPGLQN